MADVVNKYELVLALRDEASAESAKVTAAIKAMGDASAVSAEKARALSAATSAVRSAQASVTAAQRTLTRATRTGDPEQIGTAQAGLEAAQASAAEAVAAQTQAKGALAQAREAQAAARSAVSQAEQNSRRAAAAVAREEAAAAAAVAEISNLNRERANEVEIVGQLSEQVAALSARRTTATAAERAAIDGELVGLQRAVGGHEEEILAIDQKVARLREVAAIAAASSAEEVATIRATTDARLVELRVMRDKRVAAAAGSVGGDATEEEGSAGLLGSLGGLGELVAFTAGTIAVAKFTGALRDSVEAARESVEANERLRASLQDNVGLYDEVAAAAAQTATQSRFSTDQLTVVAERLSERGVDADQIPKALKVAADVAVSLHEPIEDVADQIAQTFGGTVPRDLRHAVSALQELSPAALEAGGALDVLEQRFGGRALTDSLTLTGREAESVRDYGEAWKQAGAAILPIYQNVMLRLRGAASVGLTEVSDLAANGGAGFHAAAVGTAGDVLGAILPGQLGTSAAAALHAAESQINLNAAAKDKADANAEMATEGAAARAQVEQLRSDDAKAVADGGAKELTEVQKRVAEEVRLRKAGVDELIAAINARSAAEVKPLDDALRTAEDQRSHAANAADSQRDIAQAAFNRGDEPARNTANIAEAAERQKILDLDGQILKLRQQIAAITKTAADDQSKALADAGKTVEQDVGRAGQQLHEQLYQIGRTDGLNPLDAYGKGADAANAYAQSIAVADAHLNQLIADATRANDPATAGALSEIKLKIDVDAQHTLDQVHTLAGDAKDALEQPLSGAFDKMIMTKGSFTDRLRAGTQEFLQSLSSMLAEYAAKMAANAVLTGLLGNPTAGSGGAGAAGGLVGGLTTALFGGAASKAAGAVGSSIAGPPAPPGLGNGASQAASGGLIGGVFNGIGKMLFGSSADANKAPVDQVAAAAKAGTGSTTPGGASASAAPAAGGIIGGLFNGIGTAIFGPTPAAKIATSPSPSATLAAAGVGGTAGAAQPQPPSPIATPNAAAIAAGGGASVAGAGLAAAVAGKPPVIASAPAAGPPPNPTGGIAGGIGSAIGGLYNLGSGALTTTENALGTAASEAGSVASGAGSTLAGIVGNLFAEGGYTGDGHPSEPAGVVHRREHVMSAPAVAHYGTDLLDAMNDRSAVVMRVDGTRGYATGGPVGGDRVADPPGTLRSGDFVLHARGGMGDVGSMSDPFGGVALSDRRMGGSSLPSGAAVAIRYGTDAPQIGGGLSSPSRPGAPSSGQSVVPAIVMNDQTASQLASSPALQRQLAKQQLQNPSVWAPVHKSYGK